jgi:hypothetical protein
MFSGQKHSFDEGVFRADHYTPEPPPTPAQMFRQLAMVVGVVAYMATVISLFGLAFGGH